MNPRRRRHNRIARKERVVERFMARAAEGTYSNLGPFEPITPERIIDAIEQVRALLKADAPLQFRASSWLDRLEPLPPSFMRKYRP